MGPDDIVIVAARRTPVGSFLGQLSSLSAPALGSVALQAVLTDSGLDAARISEVLLGCVLPAGVGQAPARQAALGAGIPESVGCTTLNKLCGSGMKAIMLGHDLCRAGSADIILAGGMESMSNAPYLLPKARQGYRLGHQQLLDHMFLDGLENAQDGKSMGYFAELCADRYGFTREQQDTYAAESVRRAVAALDSGALAAEMAPVTVSQRAGKGQRIVEDEQPRKSDVAKIPLMKPAFREGGTVTAANASSISDGAAAVLLMRRSTATALNLTPLARIAGHASHAQAAADFTTAPIGAIKKLHDKVKWEADLYEINEAFAVVALAAIGDLDLNPARVNVNGGACAIGHPLGASGARLIVTLLYALRQRGFQRGIAALCIGGGEATAVALEIE